MTSFSKQGKKATKHWYEIFLLKHILRLRI